MSFEGASSYDVAASFAGFHGGLSGEIRVKDGKTIEAAFQVREGLPHAAPMTVPVPHAAPMTVPVPHAASWSDHQRIS